MDEVAAYRPGACNIGPAEVARRRRSGLAGLLTSATLAVLMIASGTDPLLRWILVVPLYVGISGLVQARLRFCVSYALMRIRNLGPPGSYEPVTDPADVRADRRRAVLLAAAVWAASAAIAAVVVALPA